MSEGASEGGRDGERERGREGGEGNFEVSYYGGARCPGSGHSRVVNVYF